MKLLNRNICMKKDNAAAVVELLTVQDADVVTLQECMRPLSSNVSAANRSREYIEEKLATVYPYRFFAPLRMSDVQKKNGKIERDFGGYVEQGNAILSKYPLVFGANHFFYKDFNYMPDWTKQATDDHGRALQIAHIQLPTMTICIANLHGLNTNDKQGDARTVTETRTIVDILQKYNLPTLLAGDFNLFPETPSIAILDQVFANQSVINNFTTTLVPAKMIEPRFANQEKIVIDYIFTSHDIQVASCKTITTEIADHLPVVAKFTL